MREGGGPGHDLGPAVLHRVRHRPQHREALQPLAQLHSGLLPTRGQLARTMAPAGHPGIQKGIMHVFCNKARDSNPRTRAFIVGYLLSNIIPRQFGYGNPTCSSEKNKTDIITCSAQSMIPFSLARR